MFSKIYFYLASSLLLFSVYYELVVNGFSLDFYKIFLIVTNILVVLGGYSYFFKKQIFSTEVWKKIWYVVAANLGLSLLLQFMPKFLAGEFSIYYFNLLANLTGFILGTILFVPLYFAVYQLKQKTSDVNPRMNALNNTALAVKLRRNHGREPMELHRLANFEAKSEKKR
ncbi:hypothetical protein A2858_01770 [Candidatus Daviesbacteria bacterium RIFCSPHIGHO2_01_FULL_36_37]|uniref:Uncharacterized protein n=4 Tax=Candidatus Daviesiibacteriota TaxID=1752718 RepID=A0A0G0HE55_9BACT|nr:MAG: hypothetical protein US19_C0005G0006 [Candidatus Daviesbacteria bacterium GW2011_GWB1_36_5]KKQ15773.1 MAG: hypothetical protein US28_C0010G0006 [Candidatus Daviesbacteria bacterium GW2011_GWA1_36_8]OGE16555.1 MAG: hypothetical protein A2858_01770 [Candidatus Daviesbacteria bacterium RIFCSPHIGHO2_01_FULL_36_37]OGE31762.1 MAG: hypothetical protein A3C99_03030 [Candidatus Daviesbacteria bacterium RIFCSPHIGHO2_02_FULL_37_9]OGE34638.1 MAG: hypothetical protein A3E66_03330 [Candidatus Daviesb